MSISAILVKAGGVILFLVGLGLVLAAVGVGGFGVSSVLPWYISILLGGVLIGAGVVIIRGGTITA